MDLSRILELISKGRTDLVIELLALPDYDVNEELLNGAYYGHWKVGDFLITQGANVNTRLLNTGETPLHRATAYADERIVSLLLEHGADREARDVNGDSPLSWASYHLRPAAILKMLTFGDYRINDAQVERMKSDQGDGFGNEMDWNFIGAYLTESLDKF